MTWSTILYPIVLLFAFLLEGHTTYYCIRGVMTRYRLQQQGELTIEQRRALPLASAQVGLKLGILSAILNVISTTLFGAATILTLRVETFALGKGCYLTAAIITLFLWAEIENRCREWFDQHFPRETSKA